MVDNSFKKGAVEVHTPDANEYHQDLTAYGTTIPSATKEGGSRGFDPNKPGIVIVDPDTGELPKLYSKNIIYESFKTKNYNKNQLEFISNSGKKIYKDRSKNKVLQFY